MLIVDYRERLDRCLLSDMGVFPRLTRKATQYDPVDMLPSFPGMPCRRGTSKDSARSCPLGGLGRLPQCTSMAQAPSRTPPAHDFPSRRVFRGVP